MSGEGSQFPLVKLAAKYQEMQRNGPLLSNRASIDVIRKRIVELVDRIDANQNPNRIATLQKLWYLYTEQMDRGQELEAIKTRAAINDEMERAYHDYASWVQVFEAIDLDRKLVESEVKIAKDIQAILTAEDAYKLAAELLSAIVGAVNGAELKDEARVYLLKRIQYEFTRIVGDSAVGRSDGSGRETIDA